MNKKQFNRITNLYRDGVTDNICITSIIEMSKSDFEASIFISRFYNEMVIDPLEEEIKTLRLELRQWQEIEERLKAGVERICGNCENIWPGKIVYVKSISHANKPFCIECEKEISDLTMSVDDIIFKEKEDESPDRKKHTYMED
jgi:hypothetical protein